MMKLLIYDDMERFGDICLAYLPQFSWARKVVSFCTNIRTKSICELESKSIVYNRGPNRRVKFGEVPKISVVFFSSRDIFNSSKLNCKIRNFE